MSNPEPKEVKEGMAISDVMAPFAMFYQLTLRRDPFDEEVKVKGHDILQVTGLSRAVDEADPIVQVLLAEVGKTYAGDVKISCYPTRAQHRLPPEPADGRYEERVKALSQRLATSLPGMRSGHFGLPHNGWLSIIETAVNGLIDRTLAEPGCSFRIQQVKEKFGELRFYVQADGSEAYRRDISLIAHWAEASTVGRCIATGAPGTLQNDGWILTLSPAMAELRRTDPDKLRAIMLPVRQA